MFFWHPVPSFPGSCWGSGACLAIFGILCHHHFLVPARVPLPTLLAFCSGLRGLSPYSFGILFHLHFLVLARVPGLVSLFFWHPVQSSCPGSCWGTIIVRAIYFVLGKKTTPVVAIQVRLFGAKPIVQVKRRNKICRTIIYGSYFNINRPATSNNEERPTTATRNLPARLPVARIQNKNTTKDVTSHRGLTWCV